VPSVLGMTGHMSGGVYSTGVHKSEKLSYFRRMQDLSFSPKVVVVGSIDTQMKSYLSEELCTRIA